MALSGDDCVGYLFQVCTPFLEKHVTPSKLSDSQNSSPCQNAYTSFSWKENISTRLRFQDSHRQPTICYYQNWKTYLFTGDLHEINEKDGKEIWTKYMFQLGEGWNFRLPSVGWARKPSILDPSSVRFVSGYNIICHFLLLRQYGVSHKAINDCIIQIGRQTSLFWSFVLIKFPCLCLANKYFLPSHLFKT